MSKATFFTQGPGSEGMEQVMANTLKFAANTLAGFPLYGDEQATAEEMATVASQVGEAVVEYRITVERVE